MTNPLLDPMMQSIASTLAGNAAAALTDAGKQALAKIRELLTHKSTGDKETAAKVAAAEDREPEHPKVRELAEHLAQLAAADPEFERELRSHGDVLTRQVESHSTTTNHNTGNVTNLWQGRDFGDITFN